MSSKCPDVQVRSLPWRDDRARAVARRRSCPRRRRGSTSTPSGCPSGTPRSSSGTRATSASPCSMRCPTTRSGRCSSGSRSGRSSRPSAATTPCRRRRSSAGSVSRSAYAKAFAELERRYVRPASHETHSVTTRLIAPTIMAFGDEAQRRQLRRPLPQRTRALLPAVLRARRRVGPRRPGVSGDARRRRVGGQRAEGLELRARGSPSGVS